MDQRSAFRYGATNLFFVEIFCGGVPGGATSFRSRRMRRRHREAAAQALGLTAIASPFSRAADGWPEGRPVAARAVSDRRTESL